jgi:hypothetical protein
MAEVVKFLTTEDNLEVNMIFADPLSSTAAGTRDEKKNVCWFFTADECACARLQNRGVTR